MNIFKRAQNGITDETSYQEKMRKRVSRISTHELLNWADTAGSGMAKAFQDYRQYGELDSLLEIDRGVSDLRAVADELRVRHDV